MTAQVPIPDYAAARRAMVESQLRPQGVVDQALLAAMSEVPRETFVPAEVRPLAYADRALPLGNGRMMSSSAVVGQLLTELAPAKGERALVVGAASGYSAAVLTAMGVEVIALESDPALAAAARELGVQIVEGPLDKGHRAKGPYDLILLDGAVEFIPDSLVKQLRDGGRLGGALVERGISRLIVGRKIGEAFGYHSIADAGVAALPGFARPRSFTF